MSKPSVLIIGGGVFGTSTAYHLAQRGYTNVTVVDRFAAPSRDSAGTDLNKVIRADYPNPHYAKLGLETLDVWKDPESLFQGLYSETGWIMGGHPETNQWLENAKVLADKTGREGVEYLSQEEMKEKWPALTGDFPGWTNLFSPQAGWVPSGQALLRMAKAAEAMGVRYITGPSGQIKTLVYDENKTCKGAIAANGRYHFADKIIVSAGASLPALINGARTDVRAETSVICVIKLEPDEIEKYKDIPIIDDFEQGIIFPPDENGLIKLCSVRLVTNYEDHEHAGSSILHSIGDYPFDGCPQELEVEIRQFVRDMMPELADRPFVHTRMCWDGMATDLNFRICPYPETENLIIATAGSNHGFKFLPIIGKYVADLVENKLDPGLKDLWRWKFGEKPTDFQDPHPYPRRDLSELTGWKGRNAPAGGKLPWTWSRSRI
ncbi:FAD dependent oxidoreductase [Fusarium venenatum]|uniref:FAD dependent oxidoreductase n=1 Tax=Fusarium venenatum TaxID=56646 RepID=UPI001D6024F9|nr:FAD dependent oxidoreductase [Fusarium venenatum]